MNIAWRHQLQHIVLAWRGTETVERLRGRSAIKNGEIDGAATAPLSWAIDVENEKLHSEKSWVMRSLLLLLLATKLTWFPSRHNVSAARSLESPESQKSQKSQFRPYRVRAFIGNGGLIIIKTMKNLLLPLVCT